MEIRRVVRVPACLHMRRRLPSIGWLVLYCCTAVGYFFTADSASFIRHVFFFFRVQAWSGSYSSRTRHGNKIEAIKEELDVSTEHAVMFFVATRLTLIGSCLGGGGGGLIDCTDAVQSLLPHTLVPRRRP